MRSLKFKILKFQDSLHPLYSCGVHEESTSHFPLRFLSFATERSAFLSKTSEIERNLLNYIDSVLSHILLFGISSFNQFVPNAHDKLVDIITNMRVLYAAIDFTLYILKSWKNIFGKIRTYNPL